MQAVREYQIPPWVAIFALQTANWLIQAWELFTVYLNKTEAGFKYAFFTRWYTFFEGNPVPYLENNLSKTSLVSGAPEWYYSPDESFFIQAGLEDLKVYGSTDLQNRQKRHIPFLSADIEEGSSTLYDLTDFVEQVRWVARNPSQGPSVAHIVAAWSIHSGVVFDTRREFTLHWINTEGEVNSVAITDRTPILQLKGPVVAANSPPVVEVNANEVVPANSYEEATSESHVHPSIPCSEYTPCANTQGATAPVVESAPLYNAVHAVLETKPQVDFTATFDETKEETVDPALALLTGASIQSSAPVEEAAEESEEEPEVAARPPPRAVARHRRRGVSRGGR